MTTYVLHADPGPRHQTAKRGNLVHVDGAAVRVRALDAHSFITDVGGRPTRIRGIAHGDDIHLQLNGRACLINRIDPTRSGAAAAGEASGSATAPMPGVVVNWLAQPGSTVKVGDALLVIESMKLQMTIDAPQTGWLEDLPFSEGQTFQRGAVLARVRAEEAAA